MTLSSRGKILGLLALAALLVALPVILYLQSQQQDQRSKAAQTTSLFFTPATTNANPLAIVRNQTFTVDLMMNPGANAVSTAKIEIKFDGQHLEIFGSSPVVINSNAFTQILEGPVVGNSSIRFTVAIGSDPSKAITTTTKVASITFRGRASTISVAEIGFGPVELLSVGSGDQANENVYAGGQSAFVAVDDFRINGRVIQDFNGNHQWDSRTEPQVPANYGYNITISKDGVSYPVTHNDNGNGQFSSQTDLARGTYTVTYTNPPAGVGIFPSPPSYQVTLGKTTCAIQPTGGDGGCNAGSVSSLNFALALTGPTPTPTRGPTSTPARFKVSGVFFEDFNRNAVIDSGEVNRRPLRPRIEIRSADGKVSERTSNERDTGTYAFTNLPAGNYTLSLNGTYSTSGHTITTPQPFPYSFTLNSDRTVNIGIVSNATLTPTPKTPTPTRTPTPKPGSITPTPTPPSTPLSFTVFLHGIGKSGDSANETNSQLSNKNPLTHQRDLTLQIFDANNQPVSQHNGAWSMFYDNASGSFKGVATLQSILQQGAYTLKVGTNKYLTRSVPGIITLKPGQTNVIPPITLIAGDAKKDNALDIFDYNMLYGCYSVAAPARSCTPAQKTQADLNDDGAVNQYDYNLFLRELGNRNGD